MSEPALQISYSLANIRQIMDQFWQYANRYSILAFNGEMGAGKTTFIGSLCEYLGVEDHVSSPTFALINEYHFQQNGTNTVIYHMDWYRIRTAEEAVNAGIEDLLLQPGTFAFIEWPSKFPELLDRPHLQIDITYLSTQERQLFLTPKV